MISNGDATIILTAMVLDEKIYKLAVDKLDDPIFDPATQYSYDFVWKQFSELSEEAGEMASLSMLSARLSDAIEDLGPEDAEWVEDIIDLYEGIEKHKGDPIKYDYVMDVMQRIANEQVHKSTEEMLSGILEREAPNDVRKKMTEEIGKIMANKELRSTGVQDAYVQPLLQLEEMLVDSKAWPTGVSWFDEVSGGGIRTSMLWGFLAPSGGGKTTFAVQVGLNWVKQSPEHHCVLFTYEQPPEGDITSRILCQATGESVNKFRDKRLDQIEPEIRDKAVERIQGYAKRVHIYDFSKPGMGDRGLIDLEEGLKYAGLLKARDEVDTYKVPPTLVFLDWLIPFLQRVMAKDGAIAVGSDLRGYGTKLMDELKAFKNKYHVTFILNHQLKSEASKASSARRPELNDSAEWSGFCWMLDNCWGVGNRSDADIAILAAAKARANARSEKFLKLDGEFCRFLDVSNDYMVVNGKMQNKTMQPTREKASKGAGITNGLVQRINKVKAEKAKTDVTALSEQFSKE